MNSNLTFFQTIVAGDSWGKLAIPIIEANPWTAIIFVMSLLTMAFGVLNLGLAVVVDSFAETRSRDVTLLAKEMERHEAQEKKSLYKLFGRLDEDGNSVLTLAEIQDGARRLGEFRNWLKVLHIDVQQLPELFHSVDKENTGEVEISQFVDHIYGIKNKSVQNILMKIDTKQNSLEERMRDILTRGSAAAVSEVRRSVRGSIITTRTPITTTLEKNFRESEEAIAESVAATLEKATKLALDSALEVGLAKVKEVMVKGSELARQVSGSSTSDSTFAREVEYLKRHSAMFDHFPCVKEEKHSWSHPFHGHFKHKTRCAMGSLEKVRNDDGNILECSLVSNAKAGPLPCVTCELSLESEVKEQVSLDVPVDDSKIPDHLPISDANAGPLPRVACEVSAVHEADEQESFDAPRATESVEMLGLRQVAFPCGSFGPISRLPAAPKCLGSIEAKPDFNLPDMSAEP